MKLLRLDLRAFGPFTGIVLDLEAGGHGLHLIHGPNEAGKSSALRALRQLFFGIEERTPDAFLHPYTSLRIGARVRHSDGAELGFVRRKGNKNTLRGADDAAVLDPQELRRFLGGVDEGLFQAMFGIDRQALEEGGRQIVQGGGQLGQVLFAAGSGIANLRDVQKGLKKELDDLFLPLGKKQKINKALLDLHEAQASVKNSQLSGDDWTRHDRALREARETRERLEEEKNEKKRAHNRLTRIRAALPGIARWKELWAERETCRDVFLLPPDFAKQRAETVTALRMAEERVKQSGQTLEQLDERLSNVEVHEALLENASVIESNLREDLGSHRKAMADRPRLVGFRQQMEHGAKEILKALGRPPDLAQVEQMRPIVGETAKIRALADDRGKLAAILDNAREHVTDLQARLDRARDQLEGLPSAQDPTELRKAVARAQKEGALEERWEAERDALRQAECQAAVDLTRLRLAEISFTDLERLPVPSSETVERFDNDYRSLQTEAAALRATKEKEEAALLDLDRQIESLRRYQEVPTEEDLARARDRRELGWQLVRRAWRDRHEDEEDAQRFIAASGPARDLAEAYERGVQQADGIADRLRREADRVATQVKLVADRNQRRLQCDQLARKSAEAEERLQRLQQSWAAVWQPLGVEALSPREMQAWLRRYQDLVQQARAMRVRGEQTDRLRQSVETHRQLVGTLLQRLGDAAHAPTETLAHCLERAQERVSYYEGLQRQRQDLERTAADLEWKLREADARAVQAEKNLLDWQAQWARALTHLGLAADLTPIEALAHIEAVGELFQKLHEADGNRRRIDGMDRDAGRFQTAVSECVQHLAPDLADMECARAVDELTARLTHARTAAAERASLRDQRDRAAEEQSQARQTLTETRIRLDALCREANCSHPDELPLAEQRSTRRRQLDQDIALAEDHLRALSAGATVGAFIADAAEIDPDALDPEIGRLGEQLGTLETETSRLDKTIGGEETTLAAMDGSAAAAEAAERAELLRAQLHNDVERYALLRLAAAVLQKGIERYREKNQGPVLDRASGLFAGLSVGSFEGLRIDYLDSGEPVLVGVRGGGGQTVGVDGMSDGSRDQLYLALRLASLEAWLKTHEPIPFIVDDILLNFDNDRSVAALQALAGLSRHTQVIFFTHHEHLVELANRHLDADVLFTHRLR